MRLDFSQIGGTIDDLKPNLDKYCDIVLNVFAQKYGNQIYLILDKYDNFTNTVLSLHGEAVYRSLTHADGFYRDLFKKFKGTMTRVLMMGVSPVTMDDLTSGYNIATNITTDFRFNQMLGFSEMEVRQMLSYYCEKGVISLDVEEMVAWLTPMHALTMPSYDSCCSSTRLTNIARVSSSRLHRMGIYIIR